MSADVTTVCGRFTITTDRVDTILRRFNAEPAPGFNAYAPRYNIAPGQSVPAIVSKNDGTRYLANVFWGLFIPWGDKSKMNFQANVRDDTILRNKFFRDRLLHNRCVFVADGFYEWQKPEGFKSLQRGQRLPRGVRKTPYRITLKTGEPFPLAGLWRTFEADGQTLVSAAIITTHSNSLMHTIHDRMPVLLSEDDLDAWLDPTFVDFEQLYQLLDSYPAEEMEAYLVNTTVNSSRVDSPACIKPAM